MKYEGSCIEYLESRWNLSISSSTERTVVKNPRSNNTVKHYEDKDYEQVVAA